MINNEKLSEDIEKLRNNLSNLIALYGERSEIVLKCSQELDELICMAYKPLKSENKTKKSAYSTLREHKHSVHFSF